jgi:hypothetical protein
MHDVQRIAMRLKQLKQPGAWSHHLRACVTLIFPQHTLQAPAIDSLRKLVESHARSTEALGEVDGLSLGEVDSQLAPLQQQVS